MNVPADLRSAYAHCERLAARHYENFPVVSRLLPSAMRPHVAAIYAFARTADDMADEGQLAPSERHRRLDDWHRQLLAAVAGNPQDGATFTALAHTITEHELPVSLFEDLLSAFHQDVDVTRFATWASVLDYCRRSADPVGRLVLRLAGLRRDDLDACSDFVCSALQLTNFLQDLAIDWSRGRLYVPEDVLGMHGAETSDLDAGRMSPQWRRALADVASRTRALYEAGRSIGDSVPGRLRWQLRATWVGGTTILDDLERTGFDVFKSRPSLTRRDIPRLVSQVVLWRRDRRPAVA